MFLKLCAINVTCQCTYQFILSNCILFKFMTWEIQKKTEWLKNWGTFEFPLNEMEAVLLKRSKVKNYILLYANQDAFVIHKEIPWKLSKNWLVSGN